MLHTYLYNQMNEYMSDKQTTIVTLLSPIDILYLIILLVSAVTLAVKRNPSHPIIFGALALLFPDIYILQYVFRHFVLGHV